MINNKNIKIDILYKFKNEQLWNHLSLKAEEYFDKNYIEKDEIIGIDSIPIFDHAIKYIATTLKEKITNTKLIIVDITTNEKREISETYWNFQKNSIVERIDTNTEGEITYNELILTSLVSDHPEEDIWEIIRFLKEGEFLEPTLHTFIIENENGLVSERKIVF